MPSCYVLKSGISGNCPSCKGSMESECHVVSAEVSCGAPRLRRSLEKR